MFTWISGCLALKIDLYLLFSRNMCFRKLNTFKHIIIFVWKFLENVFRLLLFSRSCHAWLFCYFVGVSHFLIWSCTFYFVARSSLWYNLSCFYECTFVLFYLLFHLIDTHSYNICLFVQSIIYALIQVNKNTMKMYIMLLYLNNTFIP